MTISTRIKGVEKHLTALIMFPEGKTKRRQAKILEVYILKDAGIKIISELKRANGLAEAITFMSEGKEIVTFLYSSRDMSIGDSLRVTNTIKNSTLRGKDGKKPKE